MTKATLTFIMSVLLVCVAPAVAAPLKAQGEKMIFAVVLSRHGVRNPTKAIDGYTWPQWYAEPNSDGYLSAHGYQLATFMGEYELAYLRARGLLPPEDCSSNRIFAWADVDQRTIETGKALLAALEDPGHCAHAIELRHTANHDPLFHPLPEVGGTRLSFEDAKRALEAGAMKYSADGTLEGIVARNQADFIALQTILAGRCLGSACEPFYSKPSAIESKDGLAELAGPIPFANSTAENLFLEYAQCRPFDAILGHASGDLPMLLEQAMHLRVLAYRIAQRNPYAAKIQGSNMLAHIVALLDAKAGRAHPFAAVPSVEGTQLALIVGHDSNVASVAGILGASWPLGAGMVRDDMPPLGALIFELYADPAKHYMVRLRFASQSLTQMRHAEPLADGAATYPVTFGACGNGDCRMPLERFERFVSGTSSAPFIEMAWPASDPSELRFPKLTDPAWTSCE